MHAKTTSPIGKEDTTTTGIVPAADKKASSTTGIIPVASREEALTTGIVPIDASPERPATGILPVEPENQKTSIPINTPESGRKDMSASHPPKGMPIFIINKTFAAGERIWHPLLEEAGLITADENYHGSLTLAAKGEASRSITPQRATILTVKFEISGIRRLMCNIEPKAD